MKPIRQTLIEMALLTVVATTVAMAGNAMRPSGSLKLGQNYFDKGTDRAFAAAEQSRAAKAARATDATTTQPEVIKHGTKPASSSVAAVPPAAEDHLDHPYQKVTFDEVVAILDDPNTEMGVNLFVDARGDVAFAEGRIPGALQLNHYELENHLDDVLFRAEAAEKIVVYCNGGDCEDSILVCTDLLDAGIAYDNIYLYGGGWKEWSSRETRIERGEPTGDGD